MDYVSGIAFPVILLSRSELVTLGLLYNQMKQRGGISQV